MTTAASFAMLVPAGWMARRCSASSSKATRIPSLASAVTMARRSTPPSGSFLNVSSSTAGLFIQVAQRRKGNRRPWFVAWIRRRAPLDPDG